MDERKLQFWVKTTVAVAVVLMVTLVSTLVIQFSILMHQKKEKIALEAAQAELRKQIKHQDELREHMLDDEYVDEYALLYLSRGKEGSKVLVK